jgi:hypothetical protein
MLHIVTLLNFFHLKYILSLITATIDYVSMICCRGVFFTIMFSKAITALEIRPTEKTAVGKIASVVETSKFLWCSGVRGYGIDLQWFRVVTFS